MSKPKARKPPPPPPPAAIPEAPVEAKDTAVKRIRRRGGFARQIVTGRLAPQSGKKTKL